MKPIISEDTIAPSIDPIVPNTITAKDGNKSVNAVTGENRTVIANAAPPRPHNPAVRKALYPCILSTLIPLLAANSGLSATARILRPSLVFFRRRRRRNTEANITIGVGAL